MKASVRKKIKKNILKYCQEKVSRFKRHGRKSGKRKILKDSQAENLFYFIMPDNIFTN